MKEAAGLTVAVTLADGTAHQVRLGSVTGSDAKLFRAQVGTGLLEAIAGGALDLDTIAGLVWLSRRRGGERSLPYQTVADTLAWEHVDRVDAYDAAEQGGGPPTTRSTPGGPSPPSSQPGSSSGRAL